MVFSLPSQKPAPQLNVTLTALGIYSLTNSSDGSLDEQIALTKQEAASYQATIEALNRELAGMNTTSAMTDQEILAKKAAAEAERALLRGLQAVTDEMNAKIPDAFTVAMNEGRRLSQSEAAHFSN